MDHYSDLPGENSENNKAIRSMNGLVTTTTNTAGEGRGEFDYSPTVDGSLDHGGRMIGLHSNTFPVAMAEFNTPYHHDFSTASAGNEYRIQQLDGAGGGPEIAWLAAAAGHHGGGGGGLHGVGGVGLGVGNGWEEWFWQNEQGIRSV